MNNKIYYAAIFKELPNCHTVEAYEALLPWMLKDQLPHFNVATD